MCTKYGMQQAFEVFVAFGVSVYMHVTMAVGYVCVFCTVVACMCMHVGVLVAAHV